MTPDGAAQGREAPHAVVADLARTPAQRSLCGARQARRLSLPRRLSSSPKSTTNIHLLKSGARVVDLGAAPGGWSEIAQARASAPEGRVIALDILDMKPIAGVEFLQLDFLDDTAPERLKAMLGGKADVVLSDMAANATGHRQTDHLRIMALAEAAALFRSRGAWPMAGAFSAKCCKAAPRRLCFAELKRDFATVKHVKPPASRTEFGGALSAGPRLSRRLRVADSAEFRSASASRPESSAPASGGSRMKTSAADGREHADDEKGRRKISGAHRRFMPAAAA